MIELSGSWLTQDAFSGSLSKPSVEHTDKEESGEQTVSVNMVGAVGEMRTVKES